MTSRPASVDHRSRRLSRTVGVPVGAHLTGQLVRRYKRFLADVRTGEGSILTVHCPNPGSMLGCNAPGAAVRCSSSDDPRRKLKHTLEMIRCGRCWVGVHPMLANRLVARALKANVLPDLQDYRQVRREVDVGRGSRLDFRLHGHPRDARPAYLEVKSATLAEGKRARFPDSVTERGRRHVETLARIHRDGARAGLLFVVQRADCDSVEPADDIDPAYGRALREAVRVGVEVWAVRARVTAREIRMEQWLPVIL